MIRSHGAGCVTAEEKPAPPGQRPPNRSRLPLTDRNTTGAAQLLMHAKPALLSPPPSQVAGDKRGLPELRVGRGLQLFPVIPSNPLSSRRSRETARIVLHTRVLILRP